MSQLNMTSSRKIVVLVVKILILDKRLKSFCEKNQWKVMINMSWLGCDVFSQISYVRMAGDKERIERECLANSCSKAVSIKKVRDQLFIPTHYGQQITGTRFLLGLAMSCRDLYKTVSYIHAIQNSFYCFTYKANWYLLHSIVSKA